MSNPPTVVIVEDHYISRRGLCLVVDKFSRFKVVAEVADGNDAVHAAQLSKPDLTLMDIGLPSLDGFEATRQIKAISPATRIIMLTSRESRNDLLAAMSAGADGYCLKDIAAEQLVAVMDIVLSGGVWFDTRVHQDVAAFSPHGRTTRQHHNDNRANDFGLSAREREVLQLIVIGYSNYEIGVKLAVATETVKTHVRHIMEKLYVTDRTQAAVKSLKAGLTTAG